MTVAVFTHCEPLSIEVLGRQPFTALPGLHHGSSSASAPDSNHPNGKMGWHSLDEPALAFRHVGRGDQTWGRQVWQQEPLLAEPS